MQPCARGNPGYGGYVQARRHRSNCRHSVPMKRAGFHVTGPGSGSLGGVVGTGRLASEGVQVVWSCR